MGRFIRFYFYYLLTGCDCHTEKYKSEVFHTARACDGCIKNQEFVFTDTAQAPSYMTHSSMVGPAEDS